MSSRVVENIAVISPTCDIDAERDGLIEHVLELGCRTQILGDLGLKDNEQIPGNVHQLDEHLQVVLESLVVFDDERGALVRSGLGRGTLVWVIADGARCEARDGGREAASEPDPKLDALGESLSGGGG